MTRVRYDHHFRYASTIGWNSFQTYHGFQEQMDWLFAYRDVGKFGHEFAEKSSNHSIEASKASWHFGIRPSSSYLGGLGGCFMEWYMQSFSSQNRLTCFRSSFATQVIGFFYCFFLIFLISCLSLCKCSGWLESDQCIRRLINRLQNLMELHFVGE